MTTSERVRERQVDVLEVVGPRAADDDLSAAVRRGRHVLWRLRSAATVNCVDRSATRRRAPPGLVCYCGNPPTGTIVAAGPIPSTAVPLAAVRAILLGLVGRVEGSVPSAAVRRCNQEGAVSVRLFIGNLPYSANEAELREHLSSVGAPTQIVLPTDRETGRPRGFAFVDYADRAVAEEAIRRFDQQPFKGRPLAVSEARPREERPPGAPRPGGFSGVARPERSRAASPALRAAGPGGFGPRPADTGAPAAVHRPCAAATSVPTRRRRTSASRRARTPIAAPRARSRSGRSAGSTTWTRTGEPKRRRRARQLGRYAERRRPRARQFSDHAEG